MKPWADVRLAPNGAPPTGRIDKWFQNADYQEVWNPTMRIEFECETPLARQALQHLFRGQHDSCSKCATYRPAGDTAIVDGKTWARYVRED